MAESSTGTGPGVKLVGITGIVLITAYLVLFFSLLTYVMVKVWPHCQPGGTIAVTQPTSSPTMANPSRISNCPDPAEITFFGGTIWLWWEVRLLLIVILSGALGSLVHALRSMYWYIGNRSLKWSWLAMYILLPFCGASLALVFYFVIRGGFFTPQGQAGGANPFGFAAISSLIGMFSQQAVLKLKEVAETLLTKPKPGDDPKPQGSAPANPLPAETPPAPSLKVEKLAPNSGVQAGGETVEITGSGFAPGLKVAFGAEEATVSSVTAELLTVITPPHTAGEVDVTVTQDKTEARLSNGFAYS
ncbi:MAG: IPT/TIG domain-containing protein [Acidobacteriota bacterium]